MLNIYKFLDYADKLSEDKPEIIILIGFILAMIVIFGIWLFRKDKE